MIQKGRTERPIFRNIEGIIPIAEVFSETEPPEVEQDMSTGANNLISAKAAVMDYYQTTQVPMGGIDRRWMRNLTDHLDIFNDESVHILAYAFNEATWYQQIVSMIKGDIIYAIVAFLLIVIYCSLFLGSCSPIQCRLILALVGVFCVLLST